MHYGFAHCRYRGCEPLVLSCPSCSSTFDCPPLISSICSIISQKPSDSNIGGNFWFKLSCPKCPEEGDKGRISPALLANQCDDETCNCTTRSLNLRVVGDLDRGTVCPNYPHCNGRLIRKYTEADLYKQLAYFCYILDAVRCTERVEINMKIQVQKELARVQPLVELAASIVQKLRDRCAYGWIRLNDLTVSINL